MEDPRGRGERRRCEKVSYSESLKNEGSNKRNKGRMHPKRQTKCCKTLNFPTFSRSETSHKVNKSLIITKSWIQIFHQDPRAKTHIKKLYVEKSVELVKHEKLLLRSTLKEINLKSVCRKIC